MTRKIEAGLALLEALVAPVIGIWIIIALGSTSFALVLFPVATIVGLGPASIIYNHSKSLSPFLLTVMWLLVPFLAVSSVLLVDAGGLFFGPFWALIMLFAAIAGSIAHVSQPNEFHRSRRPTWHSSELAARYRG